MRIRLGGKWAAMVIALPCLALCWAQMGPGPGQLRQVSRGKGARVQDDFQDDSGIDSGGARDRDPVQSDRDHFEQSREET